MAEGPWEEYSDKPKSGPWDEYAPAKAASVGPWDEYKKTSTAPLPDVVAPTLKPKTTAAQDFDRAVRLPGITRAEKTPLEKLNDLRNYSPATELPVEVGPTPYNQGLEARMRAAKGYGVTDAQAALPLPEPTHVKDVLNQRGGGVVEGATRAVGNVGAGLTSLENMAVMTGIGMAPKLVRAGLGAYFTAQQAMQLPEQVRHAVDTFNSPEATSGDKTQAVLEPALTTIIGGLGARGVLHDFKTSPQVQGYVAPRIAGDMNTVLDMGYEMGANRESRKAGREMVADAAKGTQARMDRFELPPTVIKPQFDMVNGSQLKSDQGGVLSASPDKPSLAQQLAEANQRVDNLNSEINAFANPPKPVIPTRELPPRPVKSAAESASVFERNHSNAADINEQVQAWDKFRKMYGKAPSQNMPLPPRARAPKLTEVVSEGPSIEEQRLRDAAERAGYDYDSLTPEDRAALSELINSTDPTRYRGEEPQQPAAASAPPTPTQPVKRGLIPEPLASQIAKLEEDFKQSQETAPAEQPTEQPKEQQPTPAPVAEKSLLDKIAEEQQDEKDLQYYLESKTAGKPMPGKPTVPDLKFNDEGVLIDPSRQPTEIRRSAEPAVIDSNGRTKKLLENYDKAMEVVAPEPGPGEEVVQPKTVDAAAPVEPPSEPITQEPNVQVPPEVAPAPSPVEVAPTPTPAPVADPVRAKVATTFGMNPDKLSAADSAIVDGMLSSDPKARAQAMARYRRRSNQAGAWNPFSTSAEAPKTESELHVAEQVAKREAARRAISGDKGMGSVLSSYWHGLRPDLIDALSPMYDVHKAITDKDKKGKLYDIRPSMEFERAVANHYRADSRAGIFAKRTGLIEAIQSLPTQAEVENVSRLLLARRAAEIDRMNVQNAADLAQARTDYAAAKQRNDSGAATRAMKKIAKLEERGEIKLGRTPDVIAKDNKLIEEFTPRYQKVLDAIKNHVLKLEELMVESGLKSKEQIEELRRMYPDYADLHRIMPDGEPGYNSTRAVASKSSTDVIQKLKGSSTLEIEDPLNNLLNKTHQVVREAAQNEVARTAASYGDLPGGDEFIRRISPRAAEKMGSEKYFTYLDNGKVVHVAAPPEYVRAARSLDVQSMGLLQKVLGGAVRAFKVGTTGINATFALSNFIRDQATRNLNQISVDRLAEKANPGKRSVVQQIGDRTGIHMDIAKATLGAIKDVADNYITGKNGMYDEMVWNGGGGNSFDLYRDQPLLGVRDIRAKKYNTLSNLLKDESTRPNDSLAVTHRFESGTSRVSNVMKGGWRELENLIGMTEDMTRLQAYRIAKAEALSRGLGEADAQAAAGKAARHSTADFYRGGNYKRGIMVLFPYANAGIQGTRSSVKAMREDPFGFTTRAAMGVALPVAIATLHNLSTEEKRKAWADIQPWEKDKSLIWLPENPVKNKNGSYDAIKLPLAPGINEIGTLVRKGIEAKYGSDPVGARDVAEAVFNFLSPLSGTGDQIAGQTVPVVGKPEVEAAMNKDFYTKKEIVPDWMMRNKAPSEQRYESTTGTAQMIGDALGVAPLKVDHVLRGHFGSVTPQVLHGVDVARKSVADAIPGDNAVLKYLRETPVGGESTGAAFGRRFLSSRGGATDDRELNAIHAAEIAVNQQHSPDLKRADELVKMWRENPEANTDKVNAILQDPNTSDITVEAVLHRVNAEQKGFTKAEKELIRKPAAVRAEYIINKLRTMSDDEQGRYQDELWDKHILTEKVMDAIQQRLANQQQPQ